MMQNKISEAIDSAMTWLVVTVLGGAVWLIRRVFTNQKQIEMLQADLRHREKQRDEDRERIEKIERGVERIEGWIVQDKGR